MIKAVLDTNVLAAGFTHPGSPSAQLLLAWLAGLYDLVVSEEILGELDRTLHKPYFLSRLGEARSGLTWSFYEPELGRARSPHWSRCGYPSRG